MQEIFPRFAMGDYIDEKCEPYVYNYHDFVNYNHHVNDSSFALAAT